MQTFGDFEDEENINDDTITAVEYNHDGEYLATGDRNGRITVLKVDSDSKSKKKHDNWMPYFQYQSHDPEFDFLKSLEIEAKINQIKFCRPVAGNNFLLSTNDKTIKLWKIGTRKNYVCNSAAYYTAKGQLQLPQVEKDADGKAESLHASTRKIFANAHTYHINSLAMNSDGETFVSADDLRIYWWNLHDSNTCFNIIDIKPDNMEELTEVITAVQFHPQQCNELVYSSSKGAIKLCDTRSSAVCTTYAKTYAEPASESKTGAKSFIADILNSISDVNYSQDGRYLVSRDYLTVKVWDVKMENKPVQTIQLHEYLRPMLYDLYTSDIIFDKFEVCCSPNGRSIATGSYSNHLKIFNQGSKGLRQITLPDVAPPVETTTNIKLPKSQNSNNSNNYNHMDDGSTSNCIVSGTNGKGLNGGPATTTPAPAVLEFDGLVDLTKAMNQARISDSSASASGVALEDKVLHCAWHPSNNTIAVAGKSGLFLYKV